MRKALLLVLLAVLIGLGWWIQSLRTAPPEVFVTQARRERLVSLVSTNGKVEPLEWTAVRADRESTVTKLLVEKGQQVASGALIAELDSLEAQNDLAAAEARIAQSRAELDLLNSGGRARDLAEISASMERIKLDLATAQKQLESLQRLVDKKAATQYELDQVKERIALLNNESNGLQQRKASLVQQQDRTAAEAKLRESETAAAQSRLRIERSVVRAPIGGVMYNLEVRKGAYLRPGDLVGHIGMLDRVRVIVYVDEPELGSIRIGQPVTITWDALPGKQWSGTVEKLPTQITALNSRQVGEVFCIIANPDLLLIPQTNVYAEIQTNVVEQALTIPKEVLRRERNETGVYLVLADNKLAWRKVTLGASSVTRLEVKQGISESDRLLQPIDIPLKEGLVVKAAPAVADR